MPTFPLLSMSVVWVGFRFGAGVPGVAGVAGCDPTRGLLATYVSLALRPVPLTATRLTAASATTTTVAMIILLFLLMTIVPSYLFESLVTLRISWTISCLR